LGKFQGGAEKGRKEREKIDPDQQHAILPAIIGRNRGRSRIWCTLPAALPLEISGRTE
jgi:hypothetical protein